MQWDPVSKRTNTQGDGGIPLYPSTWGTEEFEACLVYRTSSRTAKSIQRKTCLIKQKQRNLTRRTLHVSDTKFPLRWDLKEWVLKPSFDYWHPHVLSGSYFPCLLPVLVLNNSAARCFSWLVLYIFLGRIHVYCFLHFKSLKYVTLTPNEELSGWWVGRSFLGTVLTPWEGKSTQLGRDCWGHSQHRLRRVPHRWTTQVIDLGTWGWSL